MKDSTGDTTHEMAADAPLDPQHARPLLDVTVITSRPPIGDPALVGRVTPSTMGQSLVGTMLGHFRLEEFVGGGGMGAVFRAVDTMLDRTVAVKVLSRSQSVDHENVKRFKNEAQSAARLDNENIARVYYVSEDEGWNFIVFEFIEGQNVRDMVAERGPLPLDEAVSYAVQVCDALDHASARDVVHRDIKPSNILVTPQGLAKLVDMGLARLHHVQSGEDDLTASGVTLGTFDYISPEQARDPRSADVRSDLYSLGCSFFYMLTGRPPFPEGTVLQKLLQHSSESPPDLRQFRGDVPEEIVDVLARLLEKHPNQRYQRPADVARHLLQAAETHGITIPRRPPFAWMHEEPRLRTWANLLLPWVVPFGLLLGGVLLLDWSLPSGDAKSSAPSFVVDATDPISDDHDSIPVVPHTSDSGGATDADLSTSLEDTATIPVVPGTPPNGRAVPTDRALKPSRNPPLVTADPVPSGVENDDTTNDSATEKTIGQLSFSAESSSVENRPTTIGDFAASSHNGVARRTVHVVVGSRAELESIGDRLPEHAEKVEHLGRALELASESPAHYEIQLFINGPVDVSPMSIVRGDVTIRAADGYWPILQFVPQAGDPATHLTSMIQVFGGHLALERLHLLFDVPEDISTGWNLIQLDGTRQLSLSECWITVRNTNRPLPVRHDEVTVLHLGNSLVPQDAATDGQISRPRIHMRNCFVRGQTALLRTGDGAALDFSLENCLIAIRDTLATIEGNTQSQDNAIGVTLTLRDATVVFDDCLLALWCDSQTPYPPPIQLRCQNTILATRDEGTLVRQSTQGQPIDVLRDALDVTLHGVYYEGIGTFWKQSSLGPDPFSSHTILEMNYPQWADWWPDQAERKGGQNLLEWATPWDATQEYQDLWPRDFQVVDHQQPEPSQTSPGTESRGPRPTVGCRLRELAPQPYLLPTLEL